MKKFLKLTVLAIGMASLFNACAVKSGNEKLEKMERKDISSMITKGKTTKSGVVSMFGEPQETDFMQDGRQKWKYTFLAKREKGINYVPVVNWFTRGTNDETKTLLVLFKGDIVDDFIFSKSLGETKAGALN